MVQLHYNMCCIELLWMQLSSGNLNEMEILKIASFTKLDCVDIVSIEVAVNS